MNDDDMSLFAQEMADVKILDKKSLYLGKKGEQVDFLARKQAAVVSAEIDSNHLSVDYVEQVNPNDELSYKKEGVQDGVFKRLRQGKYAIEARLDLHRNTVNQAREQVYEFVQDCMNNDIRIAVIVHGKGDRTPDKPATLKSYINKWLRELDDIIAFHSAQRHHGGYGAVYIMLRKSAEAKLDNWEQQQKR
ncbi:DNA endonuclease SmrA [Marinomonas agarivorans]|nr:DNA endonuclease SmrA [Marinomonas agarivorans]